MDLQQALLRRKIGVIGVLLALIGIAAAAFQDDLRGLAGSDPVPVSERVARTATEMFGLSAEDELKRDWVDYLYMVLGLLAIVSAVAAFLNKEPHRPAGLAGALGIDAIAWEYLLFAVIIFLLAQLDL